MSRKNDPYRGEQRTYIPNDEIDREEKADIRQQKKGNIVNVLLGGLIVISLIAFLFVVLDSGILSGAGAQPMYGSPSSADGSGGSQVTGELTQEQKKAAEEEARKAEEEAKKKKRERKKKQPARRKKKRKRRKRKKRPKRRPRKRRKRNRKKRKRPKSRRKLWKKNRKCLQATIYLQTALTASIPVKNWNALRTRRSFSL